VANELSGRVQYQFHLTKIIILTDTYNIYRGKLLTITVNPFLRYYIIAFPRPLAELRGRGRAFACIFFVHPAEPCATKKDVGSIPNASPRTSPACADYAKRERLHCEAIIPITRPNARPHPNKQQQLINHPTRNAPQRPAPAPNKQQQLTNHPTHNAPQRSTPPPTSSNNSPTTPLATRPNARPPPQHAATTHPPPHSQRAPTPRAYSTSICKFIRNS
jgi:hypothetical protein